VAAPVETWVGPGLNGDPLTITSSASTSFVEGVPEPIWLIDQAAKKGCDAVTVESDFWVGMLDDPAVGERAGAYVKHANDVRIDMDCPL
jgi:hypothetical protein